MFDNQFNDTFLEQNNVQMQALLISLITDNYSCIHCIKTYSTVEDARMIINLCEVKLPSKNKEVLQNKKRSRKVSFKYRVHKFLVFSETLTCRSNPRISEYADRDF